MMRLGMGLAVLAAACGSSSTKSDSPGSATVASVTCPPAVDATITVNTSGTAYMPATASIPVNGIVRFVITPSHNVTSTTPGLSVDFGQTVCLQFSSAGAYNFHCSVHGFQGTVTVQ